MKPETKAKILLALICKTGVWPAEAMEDIGAALGVMHPATRAEARRLFAARFGLRSRPSCAE